MDALPSAAVSALYRHPVKGLTPEPLEACALTPGEAFPSDRLYAVEVGPSGFDPDAPTHVSKMRFAVLARIPAVAAVTSRWNAATGRMSLKAPGHDEIEANLASTEGAGAVETWLTAVLGEEATAPLRLLDGRGHRFMDDPKGAVSVLNLASVRDLAERVGRPLDPLRFRANIHVEGWPAWSELETVGRTLKVGEARLTAIKPIRRCVAVDVDPNTAERNTDLVEALTTHYGHAYCGLYLSVEAGGRVAVGDRVEWM